MPWNEVSAMSLRNEFVSLAIQRKTTISELCRRYSISRKTAYKWINHYKENTDTDFSNRSNKPNYSPNKTPFDVEALIKVTRLEFPEWGGRKLKRYLENEGHDRVPAASTITEIIKRNDLLKTSSVAEKENWIRFEHEFPNDLWQMDFKGPISSNSGDWQALTVLDDHSRFSLGIQICRQQTYKDTSKALIEVFRRYGLPKRMTMDNGNPWGISNKTRNWTKFAIWLMDQGIHVSHSRPHHPQTQGKDERFHRSLKAEVLTKHHFINGKDLQNRCESWRGLYNNKRPHDALNLEVPTSRYQISPREYKEEPELFEYSGSDITRKVHSAGELKYLGKVFYVGATLYRKTVAIRGSGTDGVLHVYYRHQRVAKLDLRE